MTLCDQMMTNRYPSFGRFRLSVFPCVPVFGTDLYVGMAVATTITLDLDNPSPD